MVLRTWSTDSDRTRFLSYHDKGELHHSAWRTVIGEDFMAPMTILRAAFCSTSSLDKVEGAVQL